MHLRPLHACQACCVTRRSSNGSIREGGEESVPHHGDSDDANVFYLLLASMASVPASQADLYTEIVHCIDRCDYRRAVKLCSSRGGDPYLKALQATAFFRSDLPEDARKLIDETFAKFKSAAVSRSLIHLT